MRYGGGQKLKNTIYHDKGIITIDCWSLSAETAGWYKKSFKSIEELKGIKMRFMGFGAKVMNKLGINTVALSFKDLIPSFKKGVIDAAEFIRPTSDLIIGLHKVAKYNYYPGWFSQNNVGELIINKNKWDGLSQRYKLIIETSCESIYLSTAISSNASQPDAMEKLKKNGVQFMNLEKSELDKLKKTWLEVAKEKSAKDPLFAKIYSSYKAFRKKYAIWGDRAYIK